MYPLKQSDHIRHASLFLRFDSHATHACTLQPAALDFVSYYHICVCKFEFEFTQITPSSARACAIACVQVWTSRPSPQVSPLGDWPDAPVVRGVPVSARVAHLHGTGWERLHWPGWSGCFGMGQGGAGCAGGLAGVFLVMRGRCGVLCDRVFVWLHMAQGDVFFR